MTDTTKAGFNRIAEESQLEGLIEDKLARPEDTKEYKDLLSGYCRQWKRLTGKDYIAVRYREQVEWE